MEELILCVALAAGAIFSSIPPALLLVLLVLLVPLVLLVLLVLLVRLVLLVLEVYWKIYPQLYWEYIFQYTPSRAGPIRENITQLI